MASSPVVCCVKWGTKYPASYANRLGNMVRRHLPGRYDFVCLTDDPTGLDSDIRPIRLPDASWKDGPRVWKEPFAAAFSGGSWSVKISQSMSRFHLQD